MVVSLNPEPHKKEFEALLNDTVLFMKSEAFSHPTEYLKLGGINLEEKVCEVLNTKASGTDRKSVV